MLSEISPDPLVRERFMKALDATALHRPTYLKKILDRVDPRIRAYGDRIKIRPDYTGSLENVFRETEWWCSYKPEKPLAFTVVRTFDIHGQMGVVDLRTVSPYLMVRLIDDKDTGYAEACVYMTSGQSVTFTSVLLGDLPPIYSPEEDMTVGETPLFEGVLGIQAGPPLNVSFVPTPKPSQSEITASVALQRGMRWARCLAP